MVVAFSIGGGSGGGGGYHVLTLCSFDPVWYKGRQLRQ